MTMSSVLQATVGFNYDFSTLPGTILLIVASAVMVALAFLGIYYAYQKIGAAAEAAARSQATADRQANYADVQAIVKQAKDDLMSDFADLVDMDKKMREQLTLATIEERALGKAAATS